MKKSFYIITMIFFCFLLYPNICISIDEIQENYFERLLDLELAINTKAYDLNCAYIDQKYYRGQKIDRQVEKAESEYEKLGKEISLLKTETIHHYKGKVPKKLKARIDEIVIKYYESKTEALKTS